MVVGASVVVVVVVVVVVIVVWKLSFFKYFEFGSKNENFHIDFEDLILKIQLLL